MSRAKLVSLAALALVVQAAPGAAESKLTAVVNVTGPDGASVAARLRRMLQEQRKLALQPPEITAVLEGQPAPAPSFEPVRQALAEFRYQDAERLLAELTEELLERTDADVSGPVAEVLGWRGLVAAVDDRESPQEQRRNAKQFFAAAFAIDEDFSIDASMISPRLRLLMNEARRQRPEMGTLQLTVTQPRAGGRKARPPARGKSSNADDAGPPALGDDDSGPPASELAAELSIDGKPSGPFGASLELSVGLHLLRVTAPKRAPVQRLIEVTKTAPVRLQVELPVEARHDEVRRLLGETASVPEGRPRLGAAQKLGDAIGSKRLLMLESYDSQRARIRLYDLGSKRMSQQFSFTRTDSSAAVSSAVERALRLSGAEGPEPRWYQRWQVWAGAGAVVTAAVATALIVNSSQDSRIQGL